MPGLQQRVEQQKPPAQGTGARADASGEGCGHAQVDHYLCIGNHVLPFIELEML